LQPTAVAAPGGGVHGQIGCRITHAESNAATGAGVPARVHRFPAMARKGPAASKLHSGGAPGRSHRRGRVLLDSAPEIAWSASADGEVGSLAGRSPLAPGPWALGAGRWAERTRRAARRPAGTRPGITDHHASSAAPP